MRYVEAPLNYRFPCEGQREAPMFRAAERRTHPARFANHRFATIRAYKMRGDSRAIPSAEARPGSTPCGTPPPWVQERLRVAHELFFQSRRLGPSDTDHGMPWVLLQSAGHLVEVGSGLEGLEAEADRRGKAHASFAHTAGLEATANANFLAKLGVPAQCLRQDVLSYNTLSNAYHARARFVEPWKLRRAVVVTNRFHMPRARHTFETIFALPQEVNEKGGKLNIAVSFRDVADLGIPPSAMRGRMEYEKSSQEWFERMKTTFTCMDSVNTFLKASQPDTGLMYLDGDSEGAMQQHGAVRPHGLLLADDGVPALAG
ncbi:unnamed protein product [Prorocentrum cordatum]|uniref:DUF218 domain-containing protein n=1 Tax=Prorocentrum cordatum TaxID=2364126 RepID=A0ABN9VET5_9DINO|nr:unnamed protein product [Polarella glacialis]